MKTILLTSAGMQIKDEILKILPKPPEQIKLAHIITAAKVSADTAYVKKDEKIMAEVGFQVQDIDIEGKNERELLEMLMDFDVIYVQGGNPFYLIKAIRESGFQNAAEELIAKGKIYIGVSAGSMIAGPTIETGLWKRKDRNIFGVTDFTAMHWIDFNIFPHYEEKYQSIYEEEIPNSKYPVKILTDDQAILIKDEEIIILDNKK